MSAAAISIGPPSSVRRLTVESLRETARTVDVGYDGPITIAMRKGPGVGA